MLYDSGSQSMVPGPLEVPETFSWSLQGLTCVDIATNGTKGMVGKTDALA